MLKKDLVVTIEDKKYKIKRFNLETVSYIVLKFGSKFLPLLNSLEEFATKEISLNAEMTDLFKDFDFTAISTTLGMLKREDIKELYQIAFNNVWVKANEDDPAFVMPLINSEGEYNVEELEYDIKLAMRILWEVAKANVDFIVGSPLASLVNNTTQNLVKEEKQENGKMKASNTNKQKHRTSGNSPISQSEKVDGQEKIGNTIH